MNTEVDKLLANYDDWPNLIKELTLYANARFKFWGLFTEKGINGYSPEEIAYEAIELVFTGVWKWNPSKSDLRNYLKYNVVKGLVANLANKKEVKMAVSDEIELLVVSDGSAIQDDLNIKQVTTFIKQDLGTDELLNQIFSSLMEGMKRAEICEELDLQVNTYNNAIRRLRSRLLRLDKKGLFESLK